MRWLKRSVVMCLAMMVFTPAPAHAWFEWLDYLSGPGRFYGVKVDLRVHCFGRTQDQSFSALRAKLEKPDRTALQEVIGEIRKINQGLNVVDLGRLDEQETKLRAITVQPAELLTARDSTAAQLQRLETTSDAIRSVGIFFSLCPKEKRRTFAIEAGFTGLGTGGDINYAQGEKIWMTTLTWGLSYRVPLPADRDIVDLGTNVGMYTFYSKGFENFSGFTIEPFVDFHLPTRFLLDDSKKWHKFFGRFTVRAGLVYFPGGFKAEQFASGPAKGDISGSEATPSLTIFYNLRP